MGRGSDGWYFHNDVGMVAGQGYALPVAVVVAVVADEIGVVVAAKIVNHYDRGLAIDNADGDGPWWLPSDPIMNPKLNGVGH